MPGKKESIHAELTRYTSWSELPEADRELLERARDVSTSAYARYSQFQVGAALLLDNGEVLTGTNQENAAYPSGLCAERVVLFAAHSRYPNSGVQSIAVFARHQGEALQSMVAPCGACRQVMAEYESLSSGPLKIIMADGEGAVVMEGMESLLPFGFQFPDK